MYLASGNTVEASPTGHLNLEMRMKTRLTTEPYCIPSFELNFLSCNTLDDFGTTTAIQGGGCMPSSRNHANRVHGRIKKIWRGSTTVYSSISWYLFTIAWIWISWSALLQISRREQWGHRQYFFDTDILLHNWKDHQNMHPAEEVIRMC